jgi:hypothetical protein
MALKLPDLRLTAAAHDELVRLMGLISDFTPIASVQWGSDGWFTRPDGTGGPLPDGWDVGFYDRLKVPPEWVQVIDGVPFVLDGARMRELDGRILDFDGRKFRVVGSAI